MHIKNKTLLACTLWITCFQAIPTMAQTPLEKVDAYPDGVMELFHNTEHKCSIPFKQGTYTLRGSDNGNPCAPNTWDQIHSFRLVNVPSASTFTVLDDENCTFNDRQKFIYTFKVVKNPTTMERYMPIEVAGATQVGELVPETTIRMERKLRNGNARDLLGCVIINRSEVPPPKDSQVPAKK